MPEPTAPEPIAAPAPVPPCDPGRAPLDIDRTVSLRVFVDDGVDPAAAQRLVDGAVAWWGEQGVRLQTAGTTVVDLPAVLVGTAEEVDAAMRARGVDPEAPLDQAAEDAARHVLTEVVLRPLVDHLRTRGSPPREGGVDVVITPRLASPGSPGDGAFTRFEGLTLRAELARREDATGDLVRLLELDGFTPTVFLGMAGIAARSPSTFEGTLTHELGHALGLDHVTDPRNLMVSQPPSCIPYLTADQARALADTP